MLARVTHRIRHDILVLEHIEENMRHLFSTNPTAILMVDGKYLAIMKANQKVAELIGFTIMAFT